MNEKSKTDFKTRKDKEMKFDVEFWKVQKYLPTKRCTKARERCVQDTFEIDIKEVTAEEFPIAFIVHKQENVYEGAKKYDDFMRDGEYKLFSEEIRTYNGEFYKPVRIRCGSAISTEFEPLDYIPRRMKNFETIIHEEDKFSEQSVIVNDDAESVKEYIINRSKSFVIFNNVVWEICGEPMYEVVISNCCAIFSICYYKRESFGRNLFSALERKEAIAYKEKIDNEHGKNEDTVKKNIEVLMPELVNTHIQQDIQAEKKVDAIEYVKGTASRLIRDAMFKDLTADEVIEIVRREILDKMIIPSDSKYFSNNKGFILS